jgi:hypothetical protein
MLPRLPDTHSDTPAKPFVYVFNGRFHIRQLEVAHPAAYRLVEYLFAPLVSHSVASACQQFQFHFQLCNALGVRPQPS